jgi:hypothetical protein
MNRAKVVSSLRQIQVLVDDCLREAGEPDVASSRTRKSSGATAKVSRNTLPKRILELRTKEFFKVPRTAREAQEKLQSSYPCEVDRIAMALLRLNERKELRKASKVVDGKKQVAYAW